jgi:ankyrin repeat protein
MKYLVFAMLCIAAVSAVYYVPPRNDSHNPTASISVNSMFSGLPDSDNAPTNDEIRAAVASRYFEESPLEKAIAAGHNKHIVAYLKAGARLDVKSLVKADGGLTYFSPKIGREALELLIDKGLDPKDPATNSMLLNTYSIFGDDGEIIHILVKRGANPNTGTFPGSPLRNAIQRENFVALRALLEEKADPNTVDDSGNTPLHAAVAKNNLEMIKLLLKAGADPKKRNRKGLRPLDVAGDIRSLLHAKEGKK